MLQRLPIAFTEAKAGNTSEILLNEIGEIVYSLYQAKGIIKSIYNIVYNNIMNSIKLQNIMNTIFMNSKKGGTPDPHGLNLTDKINLKRSDKYVALSNLSICYT